MKIFYKGKDGGEYSTVTGYWLIEMKSLFSIALLKFEDGSRDAYHNHAFDCFSWVLKGELEEKPLAGIGTTQYKPSIFPFLTSRGNFHKVVSKGTTWVLTFRGPWKKTWMEYVDGEYKTLTDGRKECTDT